MFFHGNRPELRPESASVSGQNKEGRSGKNPAAGQLRMEIDLRRGVTPKITIGKRICAEMGTRKVPGQRVSRASKKG